MGESDQWHFSAELLCAPKGTTVMRRELLAIVKSIRWFHAYLYRQKFIVRMDHSTLQWLLNFLNPECQVARWLETLQEYDFTVEHRPGLKHANADAMSRRPCLDSDCKHCTRLESSHGYISQPICTVTLNTSDLTLITGDSVKLQQAQQNDDDLHPVIEWLKAGTKDPAGKTLPLWRIDQGLLGPLGQSPAGGWGAVLLVGDTSR